MYKYLFKIALFERVACFQMNCTGAALFCYRAVNSRYLGADIQIPRGLV